VGKKQEELVMNDGLDLGRRKKTKLHTQGGKNATRRSKKIGAKKRAAKSVILGGGKRGIRKEDRKIVVQKIGKLEDTL